MRKNKQYFPKLKKLIRAKNDYECDKVSSDYMHMLLRTEGTLYSSFIDYLLATILKRNERYVDFITASSFIRIVTKPNYENCVIEGSSNNLGVKKAQLNHVDFIKIPVDPSFAAMPTGIFS